MFVLHGNVRDLVPWKRDGTTEFVSLRQFPRRSALFGQRDLVLHLRPRRRLSFGNPRHAGRFPQRALHGYDSFHGTNFSQSGLPRNPDGVLNLLDNYLRLRIGDGKKIAAGRSISPRPSRPPATSPACPPRIATRWSSSSAGRRIPPSSSADVTICLIAENLIELNQGIVQNPGRGLHRDPAAR